MNRNQYNGKQVKKTGLQALKQTLEPIGPNSQAIRTGQDIIEGAGGEGGGGFCKCYHCQRVFPENQTYPCQVKAFKEEPVCAECKKEHGYDVIDFWDEWQTWG